jgi:hypothetical protein
MPAHIDHPPRKECIHVGPKETTTTRGFDAILRESGLQSSPPHAN